MKPIRQQRVFWFIIGCAVSAVLVVALQALFLSAQNSQTVLNRQKVNLAKNDANAQTLALLKDCLTPHGKCYERQQKSTAGVVGTIGRGDVLSASAAAWCAAEKRQQTFDQILKCTLAHVKTANRGKP